MIEERLLGILIDSFGKILLPGLTMTIPLTVISFTFALLIAVAAALVVMCCGAFGISSWRGANAVDSVVMLDVNPSLAMEVSARERSSRWAVRSKTSGSPDCPADSRA